MIQIETIKWMPYPECKPTDSQVLLVKDVNGAYFTCRYIDVNGKMLFYAGNRWVDAMYWAIIPSPNPDAKTINFITALEFMKAGKWCYSCVSGDPFHIVDDVFCTGFDKDVSLSFIEIDGDWELADEQ